jgi:hypothetical protein
MSITNYDVEKQISFNPEKKNFYVTYQISVPGYMRDDQYYTHYECALSFDDGNEKTYSWKGGSQGVWFGDIEEQGIYSKAYFRNPHRGSVLFTAGNCFIQTLYRSRAPFEIQFNQSNYAAAGNPTFRCSTVQKNTYGQYEWGDGDGIQGNMCEIYYKRVDPSDPWPVYLMEYGEVTGTWSDYLITPQNPLGFVDGGHYEVYIVADSFYSSDHQHSHVTAQTPVAVFGTEDATAHASCIAPIGTFESGAVTFIWSHTNEYGSPQYAFDLQYSLNNGSSWTSIVTHEVTEVMVYSTTLETAGTYLWRVRTYNQNDIPGEWASATFVNNLPAALPTNLAVNTKGRPTVTWASVSQAAYQVQVLSNDTIVYDSGAIYSPQNDHIVNKYFNDEQTYTVRLRIYNSLGDVSGWVETGYQQPAMTDVIFTVSDAPDGGALIELDEDNHYYKYYLLRDGVPIAQITGDSYTDRFANGQTQYSVVGVTEGDQSDIQTIGWTVKYAHASLVSLDGTRILINKRVDSAYEVQTSNSADVNNVPFIGDRIPTHYASNMRLKQFTVNCFDDQGFCEAQLGKVVYYADNFGNGGYCMVTNYSKTDNFIRNSQGIYANEASLTLEVTNYDDSIQYAL